MHCVSWGLSEHHYCRCGLQKASSAEAVAYCCKVMIGDGISGRSACVGMPHLLSGKPALRQSPWIKIKTRHSPGQCPDSHTLTQTTITVKMSLPVLPLHPKLPYLAGNSRSLCASTAAYPWHPPPLAAHIH